MSPAHRYMVAFMAASLKAGRTFTHIYDHDAKQEIAVGGLVRPELIDVIEGQRGLRISGRPEALFDHGERSQIRLSLEGTGFAGYDYASKTHFQGVFATGGVVQLYDHETGRYHDFHVS